MTRNSPRITASRINATRTLMTLTPALVVAAVAVGLAGAGPAGEAAAGVPDVAVTPACLTDDLTGTVVGLPQKTGAGVRDAMLRLTNSSTRTCQVQGWADVAMVSPPGDLVPVPTRKAGQAAGAALVLKPEASAWSKLGWDTCAAGSPGCGVGVALQYVVDPDSTGAVADTIAVPEADQDGITMKALRVGPLQQTRTAALG